MTSPGQVAAVTSFAPDVDHGLTLGLVLGSGGRREPEQ